MARESFTPEVEAALGWYVYRLVDPRNGETFYVGKGKGSRVFAHALGSLDDETKNKLMSDGPADPKLERINEIKAAGLDVSHVIHRHGLSTETMSYEVEAALIDAYPGLTNRHGGKGSRDRGCRHADEICAEFEAVPFEVTEPLILISIGNMWRERGIYDAVRSRWRIQKARAEKYHLVLAHVRGVVKGAYRPRVWLKGTRENFPLEGIDLPERWGFEGDEAEAAVWTSYVGKRVPDRYRKKGAQNAIRYCDPPKLA